MNLSYADWSKFPVFYAVARDLSFSKAAKSLNLSQSSVSRTVQNLEKRLKLKLFDRHSHGAIPTQEGQKLFHSIAGMFQEITHCKELLQQGQQRAQGDLKVFISPSIPTFWLTSHLSEFMKQYPQLTLNLLERSHETTMTVGASYAMIKPREEGSDEEMQNQDLLTLDYALYAHPEYIKTYGMPHSVEDLTSHRLIAFHASTPGLYPNANWLLELGQDQGTLRLPSLTVNSADQMIEVVKAGLGIAALPQSLADQDLKLMRILPELQGPSLKLCYVYPTSYKNLKRLSALGSFLQTQLQTDLCKKGC